MCSLHWTAPDSTVRYAAHHMTAHP